VNGTAQAPSATAAQARADALFQAAREHKRAARFHRRSAQEAMQELDRLRAECARLGIRLVIHPGHSPKEA
jgi:hypothetical protein